MSLWLNSGVPATEVARRAGHGGAVLLKIYAHCIDGQADAANQRITDALGTAEPETGPGGEGDAGSLKWQVSSQKPGGTVATPLLRTVSAPLPSSLRGPVRGLFRPRPWISRPRNPAPTDA
ncbi:MAG TPA: hypothetical protein VHF26_13480 [Trebonia sp.]|nr:hypothetical protein [Trebonia sp.]